MWHLANMEKKLPFASYVFHANGLSSQGKFIFGLIFLIFTEFYFRMNRISGSVSGWRSDQESPKREGGGRAIKFLRGVKNNVIR